MKLSRGLDGKQFFDLGYTVIQKDENLWKLITYSSAGLNAEQSTHRYFGTAQANLCMATTELIGIAHYDNKVY